LKHLLLDLLDLSQVSITCSITKGKHTKKISKKKKRIEKKKEKEKEKRKRKEGQIQNRINQ
jgi:hypothetical protein